MSNQEIPALAVDTGSRWLYRVGGASALALGAGYVAIFALYARVGAPPVGDGAVWLTYLSGKTGIWWAILALSVLTDVLFVPVALALYLALQHVNRGVMLLATAFVGLFVVLDLAVTWSHYASLLTLSASYDAAATDMERVRYVAAATYASAVLGSRLFVFYAIVDLSFAILLIGIAMLKGVFNKTTAWLSVAIGITGIASVTGWSMTIIANALLTTAWAFLVGSRFVVMARSSES